MRLIIYVGLVIFFLAGLACPASTNLVPNAGFTKNAEGWNRSIVLVRGEPADKERKRENLTTHSDVKVALDDTVAHTPGGKSLKGGKNLKSRKSLKVTRMIKNPACFPWMVCMYSKDFPVKGGQEYEISLWAKADNPDLAMVVWGEAFSDAKQHLPHWYQFTVCHLTPEWRKYSLMLTPPAGRQMHVTFNFFISDPGKAVNDPQTEGASGNIWVDEVMCTLFEY